MAPSARPRRVTSLGLFILDSFEWRTSGGEVSHQRDSVIGGGGTYALIGARMGLPASEIGMLVERGSDWTAVQQRTLDAFGSDMWIYRDVDRPTTRALNLYQGEHREFKYLTERRPLEPVDLPATLLNDESWLHFVCSPTRALVIHSQLLESQRTPSLCYEPIPSACVPSEMTSLRKILPFLAVFSPNHEEAGAFFSLSPEDLAKEGKAGIELVARRFMEEGAGGHVIIRSGAMGAYVLSCDMEGLWIEAYHQTLPANFDPTGAGNSFLGGLMAGLVRYPNDILLACLLASVAASFVVEQFSLPTLSTVDGVEYWNGSRVEDRFEEMRRRCSL